ncbi:MAG TPA: alpha/beta hydrolase [Granulicella sp.]|jgi:pimeloyl-ACP methyl ester carboxylesterase|nr:alpha/beta hydrolase [Granulicella sp.]
MNTVVRFSPFTRFAQRAKIALLLLLLIALVSGAVVYLQPLWVNDQIIRLRLWNHGVKSHYAEVGGYRVHYFEALPPLGASTSGGGGGTPLVLLHGLGSRGEDWAPLIPGLAAAGFHVYAPDLLGYGRSARPDVDYSIGLQEKLVVQFLEAMHLTNADVGGWSMGGWVAAKLALDHPELVHRLLLYDSAGIYFPATFEASLFTPTNEAGLFHLTEMLDPNPKHMPPFVARAAVNKLQHNAWIVRRALGSMTDGHDLLDFRLATLQRPTLIVWGSKDVLIPFSVGETMHRLIPNSSLDIIDGCGHLAPGQCPNSALQGTVDFLKAPQPAGHSERTLPGH